jgi:hypothetical protein
LINWLLNLLLHWCLHLDWSLSNWALLHSLLLHWLSNWSLDGLSLGSLSTWSNLLGNSLLGWLLNWGRSLGQSLGCLDRLLSLGGGNWLLTAILGLRSFHGWGESSLLLLSSNGLGNATSVWRNNLLLVLWVLVLVLVSWVVVWIIAHIFCVFI